MSIAVDVCDGSVFRGWSIGGFSDRDVCPAVWVGGAERDAHVSSGVRHVIGVGHTGVVFVIGFDIAFVFAFVFVFALSYV